MSVYNLSDEQIENDYQIQHIQNYGREVDLYCVLPEKKLIMQIEIKDGKLASQIKQQEY